MTDALVLYTIGHSRLPGADLAGLLRDADVRAVADVRSVPASRIAPWHDHQAMAATLSAAGIGHVWLGAELGGRPDDPRHRRSDGRADYAAMAARPAFASGLQRLVAGAARMPVALLCAEADPTHCHRRLLVGRALATPGIAPPGLGPVRLVHLTPTGTWDEHAADLLGPPGLFGPPAWTSVRPVG